MTPALNILGIDIGSVSIGVVEITPRKEIVNTAYTFHRGDISEALSRALEDIDLNGIAWVAATASTPESIRTSSRVDDQVCAIAAARRLVPGAGAILNVGGEKFNLIRFGQNGNYTGSRGSTSCAAGTGAFLDQQARRLNLDGAAQLSDIAYASTGDRPKIASRCAVFAKTDLIHAQQEGYRVEEISDGLCHGLAKNIADTVFGNDSITAPVVFSGGVSQNRAVRGYIEEITGQQLVVHDLSHLFGAVGAGLTFIDENLSTEAVPPGRFRAATPADLIGQTATQKDFSYDPLTLKLSDYPDFDSLESYLHPAAAGNVEVDVYEPIEAEQSTYIGIDIGSTSTKAVLMTPDRVVLAGFYTRTAGRPLAAVQAIFESIDHLAQTRQARLNVIGAGTTGSGRKFIGRIIGADLILDEITAHARAATELNPDVDTIIEIGGQDAKFTTLKNGRVTSATMNTVCAAGTGSFIEEQALKLGCPLNEYSSRTEGKKAPLSSDRCTVFMERDLNHYLAEGFEVNEVLASVLHSVRENYLLKVATESRIGDVIFFQGATAKNRALVAAFEQRLNKPILVSRFCHLTGALGTALTILDDRQAAADPDPTRFRGIGLYREKIPVRSEVCELCTNHCKLSVAEVAGEQVAYGFLCGRDYDTKKFVKADTGAFDLIGQRKKAFRFQSENRKHRWPVIGIPAAVHLVEDLAMWQKFFDRLGFRTVTSERFTDAIKAGKKLTGAEFCAPITALHGHADYLLDRCDYVFMPFYMEDRERERGTRRQFCYYTQWAPALASMADPRHRAKFLTPLVRYLYTSFHTRMELYRMLNGIPGCSVNFLEVSAAYDSAVKFHKESQKKLNEAYRRHLTKPGSDIRIALLGRPYTIFSPALNSGIPELFRRHGIDCAYQSMLEESPCDRTDIQPLLNELPWRFASRVLAAARQIAATPGVYPVLITSFKCSPDSFAQEYFKSIMADYDKPYLILELDEHDSAVGYETRIEAAVRAFRNHQAATEIARQRSLTPLNPNLAGNPTGKTIVLPNWDHLTGKLLEANLRREGFDAILIEETPGTIRRSLKHNTGQCIPLNAIAEGFAECVEKNGLRPENTVLWLSHSEIACNVRLYPHHIKTLINARGNGLEKAGVYVGDITFRDISVRAAINAYLAYMFAGLLQRMACRIRPYETDPGETDRVLNWSLEVFYDAFLDNRSKEAAVKEVTARFGKIKTRLENRPKVAIFGDLYSRDNAVMNQDLVRFIERNGGEVVTTPYTQYAKMIANPYIRKWFNEGKYISALSGKTLLATMRRLEKIYYPCFQQILGEPMANFDDPPEEILSHYNVKMENTGESLDNILKVHYIKKHHPDMALFVQASPALCCPSLVTEAMSERIEAITGVPVVAITYDGTGGSKNDCIIPYLKFPRQTPGRRIDTRTARSA